MKNQIWAIHHNQGIIHGNYQQMFHCTHIDSFPEIKPSYVLYYIEIEILKSQKSHFNDTMFHDVNIKLWNDLETLKPLTHNGWELFFLSFPRGLGSDKLVYTLTDSYGQKIELYRLTDTRNFKEFCQVIAMIILQFEKASSLKSLNHHMGI